jgi:transposase InsO family protein
VEKIQTAREDMKAEKVSKRALTKKLGVSRSTLYYKPKKPSDDEAEKEKIIAIMTEHPAYGHRRVAMALKVNLKKTRRLMSQFGLKPKVRREFKLVKPDDQKKPEIKVENILKTRYPIRQNIVWAGDFTYFWFEDRFWYRATV